MYSAPQHLQQNNVAERRKENLYLQRIAQLMGTDRQTLNSYGKIKLWEDGPNYQKVVKYVNNSQCHKNIKLTVVNIHRVWRRGDEENLFNISNRQLLWHGTKRANIPHILDNGFCLPKSNGQMFGAGIYFADRISKSSNYSDQDATFLLLCEVGLGKIYSCRQSHSEWMAAPKRFDSIKANGTYVPDWSDTDKYFGSLIPFGKTARCTKYDSHAVNINEFIVFDPKRIIIRFLVEVDVEQVTNPVPLILVIPRDTQKSNSAKKNIPSRPYTSAALPVSSNNRSGYIQSSVVKPTVVKPKPLPLPSSTTSAYTNLRSTTSTSVRGFETYVPMAAPRRQTDSYNMTESYSTPQFHSSFYSNVQPREPKGSNCVIL